MKGFAQYGAIVRRGGQQGTLYSIIDSLFEDGIRKAVVEYAGPEEDRGSLEKITVIPLSELELEQDPYIRDQARLRKRNAAK